MNWFRQRPEMKLIALGLAVALYFFTATQIETRKDLTLEIDPAVNVKLQEDWVVSSIEPRRLDIVVSGPMSVIEELEAEDIHPVLEVSPDHLADGRQRFDVSERTLRLPGSVKLVQQPRSVVLEFSEMVTEKLELDDRVVVEGIPPEYTISTRLVTPVVEVRGPRSVIDGLKAKGKVPVETVTGVATQIKPDLEDRQVIEWPVSVLKPHKDIELLGRDGLKVAITVEPVPTKKQTPALPIRVLLNPGDQQKYEVALSSREVVLDVWGPSKQMKEYDLTKLRPYVDLTDITSLDIPDAQRIQLLKPDWLQYEPRKIKVTLRRRAEVDAPPPEPAPPTVPTPPEPRREEPPPPEEAAPNP